MTPSAAEIEIRARITAAGRITFAEFMEVALYSPEAGYYRAPNRISAEGDYFTSPSAHPAFGALICVQLREMWQALGRPARFTVVEPGAGEGMLARDITAYAGRLDRRFADALVYQPVDRARAAPGGGGAAGPTGAGIVGCILSNELLDAFPVHRFVVEAGRVRELYVVLDGDRLAEAPGEPSTPDIAGRLGSLARSLSDGFRGEVNLGLHDWAASVNQALRQGFVLTVDFAHRAPELYAPQRRRGTLRCYYRHTVNANPFQHVGEQDITAHVDLTALDEAMSESGLEALGDTSQSAFLRRLGLRSFLARLRHECGSQREADSNRMAMLELSKPDGLGAFRVAVHGRGVAGVRLTGLEGDFDSDSAANYPLPLLDRDRGRVQLLEGAYPAAAELTPTWEELSGGEVDVSPDARQKKLTQSRKDCGKS